MCCFSSRKWQTQCALVTGVQTFALPIFNRLTVFQAAELNHNPNNTREILRDFTQPRGSVTAADGVVLARSVPSNDRFELQREFPEGPLFAHITGYYSFTLGSAGVERSYNDELAGRTLDLSLQEIGDLFVEIGRANA